MYYPTGSSRTTSDMFYVGKFKSALTGSSVVITSLCSI